MSELSIRKTAYSVEEIFHEGGPKPPCSLRRGYAMAVIQNPFAGRYVEKIQWFMEDLKPLGLQMAEKLIALLGGADQIEGYGKGAMIGEDGELEHGALWHAPGGYAMRQLIDPSNAIVPSTKKWWALGAIWMSQLPTLMPLTSEVILTLLRLGLTMPRVKMN